MKHWALIKKITSGSRKDRQKNYSESKKKCSEFGQKQSVKDQGTLKKKTTSKKTPNTAFQIQKQIQSLI